MEKLKVDYIAIEGVIGVGKTTLTSKLAERFDGKAIYEEVEENPFLADFYEDPKRFAFPTQIFFLLSRYRQQQEIPQRELFHQLFIADYSFYKDRIFAHLNLDDRELVLYEKIATLLERDIPKPDLLVYLKSTPDRLMQNIKKRGRSFERDITFEYLQSLHKAYNAFFNHYHETPLLIINTATMDFVNNPDDFEKIVSLMTNDIEGTFIYNS